MVFKLNISHRGKTWKLESEVPGLVGKVVGEIIKGESIKPELAGYEIEITGGSDIAGFPMYKKLEGVGLKKMLFKKGWGMWDNRKGVRRRKSVRGNTLSNKIVQVNLSVKKEGAKPLAEVFPEVSKSA